MTASDPAGTGYDEITQLLGYVPIHYAYGSPTRRLADEVERLRAEVAALRKTSAAREAVVADAAVVAAKWEAMRSCYSSTEESVQLAELLDAQTSSVATLRAEGKGATGG